jgi:hypothetical protein
MSAINANAFVPTNQVVDPPNRPEPLAEAVLASLSRTYWGYRSRPWGLIKTCILSGLTFGLLPLISWPKRFRNLMIVEEQQLWHLGEWLRLRTGRPEAQVLCETAREVGPGPRFVVLPLVILFVVLFKLASDAKFHFQRWYELAYGQYFLPYRHPFMPLWHHPYLNFWAAWTLLLTLGYFFHWLTVCRHAGAMATYVREFNAATAAEGVPPVRVSGVGVGFSPLWMIAAIIGLAHGLIWALPLMLAGVVHRRYVKVTGPQIRGELARRVRWMLENNRPAVALRTTPVPETTVCGNVKCRAPLAPGSVFCSRCGTRA